MRSIAVRIGIIAVIAIIGLVGRSYLSGNAGNLKVGDCFDLPSATAATVKDVQHHPCDQDHGAEVFFVGDYPGSKSDPVPTEAQFTEFATQACAAAYQTYTGTDVSVQSDYDFSALFPLDEGWKSGDQAVTCFLFRVDEANFKGSLKKG